ncbi:MAG: transglutaminase domain-containing protein [Bacteroidia bacterium]|nr:transglutaminase domain-containing protein [Bacteroidia bacterium]
MDIFYKVYNDPEGAINFKKSNKGNAVTYEWSATNLERYRNEDHSVALRHYAPHVVVYVKSYNTSTGKKNVLSGLNDLHRWYNSFVANLDNKPSEQMAQIVNDLRSEGDTEIDVVRKIFYWVQDNIQYIAFEDGMRGFIPNSGAFVCEKRYGDCKDMANLIVSMLRVAGIKGYHTWIGTRDLPYKYTEVPTPLVDNHMIATYIGDRRAVLFPRWHQQLHRFWLSVVDDTGKASTRQPRCRPL